MINKPLFHKLIIGILTSLLLFLSCNNNEDNGREEIYPIVDRDIILFNSSKLPAELETVFDTYRIIILGEPHYVQEHQEYVSTLLREYQNKDIIYIDELSNAWSWMIEDYVSLQRDSLDGSIRFFDNYIIESIRSINEEQNSHIKMTTMDVNHWPNMFLESLAEIEEIIGEQDEFLLIKEEGPSSSSYSFLLDSLQNVLCINESKLSEKWGNYWFIRITELVDAEIKSLAYRNNRDHVAREEFMYDQIITYINNNPSSNIIINTGSTHAKKHSTSNTDITRIAEYLFEQYPTDVYSIGFYGIRGERKQHFYDTTTYYQDLLAETSENDLVHIIGEIADSNMSLLRLDDPIFDNNPYDAIITYPKITVLKSHSEFNHGLSF